MANGMNERITILAGPVPGFFYKRKLSVFYKTLLNKIGLYTPIKAELTMYGGHFGVSRSLIEGLQKLNYKNFNYNPPSLSQLGEIVVVISDIKALKQAIKWKREGKIKKLIAGPNLCVLPTDFPEITAPEIDKYITHSDWCITYFENLSPSLKGRMAKWPAGVNENYWAPDPNIKKTGKRILFFNKRPKKDLYQKCLEIAYSYGYEVLELIRGNYTHDQYRSLLNKVDFLIHFVEHESQGISLSEAWSMNVPTFVWNQGVWKYSEQITIESSSAPYLNPLNGAFFKDEIEFKNLFNHKFDPSLYEPRKWLLENLTDTKSAGILVNIVNSL